MTPIFAEIAGDGFIHQLVMVLIIMLCAAVVYGIGWYFFKDPPMPPLVMKVWNGFFILVGGLIIVNFLMSVADRPFIKW